MRRDHIHVGDVLVRKELEFYEASSPRLLRALASFGRVYCVAVERLVWRPVFGRVSVGSPTWHRLQERLARSSSVHRDMARRLCFYRCTLPRMGPGSRVYPGVCIYYPRNVYLGSRVVLNRGVFITAPASVEIGDDALVGPYVVINSGNHTFADRSRPIRGQGHEYLPIRIGEDVWIGANVTVLAGVTIGRGSVVGAGAVVNRDVEPYSVVAGVPARRIRVR